MNMKIRTFRIYYFLTSFILLFYILGSLIYNIYLIATLSNIDPFDSIMYLITLIMMLTILGLELFNTFRSIKNGSLFLVRLTFDDEMLPFLKDRIFFIVISSLNFLGFTLTFLALFINPLNFIPLNNQVLTILNSLLLLFSQNAFTLALFSYVNPDEIKIAKIKAKN